MGFQGLTSFIENNAHVYLQTYRLHDTSLVVDGCATACYLYRLCNSNRCFGGDYDKYGKSIKNFFQILSDCNITPYVIFDGGHECREIETTIERMQNRIELAEQMSIGSNPENLYPLFIRQTFYDIGHELGVKMIHCDFKSDTDIKKIAHRLGCPVLSYDSDFYIFDGLYIPLKQLHMIIMRAYSIDTKLTYHYLECSVYDVEKFLNYHGLKSKSILPLLAVLLGNNDVKKNVSSMLRNNVTIQRNQRWPSSKSHNHIRSVLIWLKKETLDSAITKVLQQYPKKTEKKY
nr:unnamed protein product [Callosobruchus chinensis]